MIALALTLVAIWAILCLGAAAQIRAHRRAKNERDTTYNPFRR